MATLRAVFRPLAKTEMPKPDGKVTCPEGATTRVGAAVAFGALVAVAAAVVGAARVAAVVTAVVTEPTGVAADGVTPAAVSVSGAAVTPAAGVLACATPVAVATTVAPALGCGLTVLTGVLAAGEATGSLLAAQPASTSASRLVISQNGFIKN